MTPAEVITNTQATNMHNQAIAMLLKSAGYMYCYSNEACDVYTRQCSTLFNAKNLSTVGATLANGGKNPVSKEQLLKESHVPYVLVEMTMEGLYDNSGDWAFEVGLPGKSGVGGGLLAVIPNVGALATFSPKLDVAGNSVRSQLIIKYITNKMGWNLYQSRIYG